MARDNGGFTPKQRAYDLAIGWLRACHSGRTGDIAELNLPPAHEREVKNATARLHNKLLAESGLDGNPISEE